jgi:thiol-disulfide isomerase/thioredoxin
MNVYIKGGIAALIMASALFAWYQWKEPSLPVNQSPVGFQLIKQMESQGVPDIDLVKLDGTPFQLSSLRGKIVIVNFWASWCNPCVEEFPSLVKLISQFNKDVVVVAVSEDETREDMQAFMKAMGLPKPGFEMLFDNAKKNMQAYGVEKIPETFLVGRDGKLIRKVLGIENWANEDAVGYFTMLTTEPGAHATPPDALAVTPSDGAAASATPTPAPQKSSQKSGRKSGKKSKKKKHHHG